MDRKRGHEDDDLLCALQDDVHEEQAAPNEDDAAPDLRASVPDPGGRLSPGLYVTAVPLGNARDITLRALDVLARADTVICEDTRMTRRLCDLHGISPRSMSVYHDHSGPLDRERLIGALVAGGTAALVSDAGTPLISDPGYKLVKEAKEAGVIVRAVPGPCALAAALSVGGAPSDRFYFAGFLPSQGGARRAELESLRSIPGTLAFYESPGRLSAMLHDVAELFPGRIVSVCRELTKRYEEAWVSSAEEASRRYADPSIARGECVVLAHPYEPGETQEAVAFDARERMRVLLQTLRVKDAVNVLRSETGLPAKALYALALECKA